MRLAAAILCASMVACGGPASPDEVIALIDGRPVHLGDLRLYLKLNLPEMDAGEQPSVEEMARIKSRMLDALIDQHRLLAEAERRGIEIDPAEIESYSRWAKQLDAEEETEIGAASVSRLIRRRLMIEELERSLDRRLPPEDEAEVRRILREREGSAETVRRLLLRSIPFDSRADAQETYERVLQGRVTFDDVVEEREIEPGQAAPQDLPWDDLQEALRDGLNGLQPGGVSLPLDLDGQFYLFQVVSWIDAPPAEVRRELERETRDELRRLRRRQAHDELMESLRSNASIALRRRQLPFQYIAEPGGGD